MSQQTSLVKAMTMYFGPDRKVEIAEMRALSREDREELREMLIAEGYDILPLPLPEVTSE